MFQPRHNFVLIASTMFALLAPRAAFAALLAVASTRPARLAAVAKNSAVTITFDRRWCVAIRSALSESATSTYRSPSRRRRHHPAEGGVRHLRQIRCRFLQRPMLDGA